ncbi:YoaK family protein [Enterococcus alishanensis]|nr:YoaK family protein [Enterococcus alishanensis]
MMNKEIKSGEPYMEFPMIAFFLAVAAGSMSGYTYFIGKAFSTVQSGNIILLGQSLAEKDWSHFFTVALTVLAFGIGAAITAIIQKDSPKNWSFNVIIIEVIVLFLLSLNFINSQLQTVHICMIISLLAGMQGNAFHKFGKDLVYGNVAVTLVVQNAFSFLMKSFFNQSGAAHKAFLYFSILVGFGFGGFAGTLLTSNFNDKALFLPIIVLLVIYTLGKNIESKTNQAISVNPQG